MNQDQRTWLTSFVNADVALAQRFSGLYRAMVLNTDDPLGQGRIQVVVPEVFDAARWAAACRTPGSPPELPTLGSVGWAMFESGDQSRPVWMGVQPRPEAS